MAMAWPVASSNFKRLQQQQGLVFTEVVTVKLDSLELSLNKHMLLLFTSVSTTSTSNLHPRPPLLGVSSDEDSVCLLLG